MHVNPIGWCTRTVNGVVGCPHRCPYCYARLQAKRQRTRCQPCYDFTTPHEHLGRLDQITPNQRAERIFLDSMWDWNAKGVKVEWNQAIIRKTEQCLQHIFLILSKWPKGYARFTFPSNVWLGTTITLSGEGYRVNDLAEAANGNLIFVSIEPIQGPINFWFTKPNWIIVGQETGHRKNKTEARKEWIQEIVDYARAERIPLYLKDNLQWPEQIQEFPTRELSPLFLG